MFQPLKNSAEKLKREWLDAEKALRRSIFTLLQKEKNKEVAEPQNPASHPELPADYEDMLYYALNINHVS